MAFLDDADHSHAPGDPTPPPATELEQNPRLTQRQMGKKNEAAARSKLALTNSKLDPGLQMFLPYINVAVLNDDIHSA